LLPPGDDGTVGLWNLLLQKQVAVLERHGPAIGDVTFSLDGHTLASSRFDGAIKLLRAAADREYHTHSDPTE
jgi:WD40 repeat protein